MSGRVVIPVSYATEWEFHAKPQEFREVWFYFRCGDISGGTFMEYEKAVSLGNMLLEAAQLCGATLEGAAS